MCIKKDQIMTERLYSEMPQTLADLEQRELPKSSSAPVQTLSYGSARYESKEILWVVEDYFSDPSSIEDNLSEKNLEDKIRQQLYSLKKAVGQGEDSKKILSGILDPLMSTISTMEEYRRLGMEKKVFPLVSKVVNDFKAANDFREQELDSSTQRTGSFEEPYIVRQSRLFQASFNKLLKQYASKYVLFHDGEVLFSGESIDEVAKNAYGIRNSRDIFIKKVSLKGDNHEILTPLNQES
jgi:hypothetical protein